MAICTNPLRASDCEKPRQTKEVCLRFSQPLASQGLGISHPYKSFNLGFKKIIFVYYFHRHIHFPTNTNIGQEKNQHFNGQNSNRDTNT